MVNLRLEAIKVVHSGSGLLKKMWEVPQGANFCRDENIWPNASLAEFLGILGDGDLLYWFLKLRDESGLVSVYLQCLWYSWYQRSDHAAALCLRWMASSEIQKSLLQSTCSSLV